MTRCRWRCRRETPPWFGVSDDGADVCGGDGHGGGERGAGGKPCGAHDGGGRPLASEQRAQTGRVRCSPGAGLVSRLR